jgi:hypothetical protein
MKISLLTVSQWPRREFLECQVAHVKKMIATFTASLSSATHIEWVVVNASKTNPDQEAFGEWCVETLKVPEVELRLITPTEKSRTIGSMRQLGNQECRGDIIVCIDDDDYYYPTRISHALKKLKKSKKELAACTSTFLLDDDLGVIVRLRGMHDRHGVNSTMAYTRKYALTHTYDVTKTFAEESSFTKGFSEPMEQLDGEHVYMQISHFGNTFSKKKILLLAMNGYEEVGRVTPESPESFLSSHSPRLLEILRSDVAEPVAQITIYCGLFSLEWDPQCQSLGGSEQAVVYLARWFAKKGKSVRVFGLFPWKDSQRIDGVDYVGVDLFRCRTHYPVLILWRLSGMMILKSPHLKADKLLVDLHDHVEGCYKLLDEYRNSIHMVMCKSNFQVHMVKRSIPEPLPSQCTMEIIPNGVRIQLFQNAVGKVKRETKHLIYASFYSRGLEPLLKHTWPILHRLEPDAVLHVCYGLDSLQDEAQKIRIRGLLQQPGIVHHGRLDVEKVALLKAKCSFQLYYTPTAAEIDCISIRESLVVGCIPILARVNVFSERHGFHVPNLGFEVKDYVKLAGVVRDLFHQNMEEVREKLKTSATVMDWEQTAEAWLEKIQSK